MIHMCDVQPYAEIDMEKVARMKAAHVPLNAISYERAPLHRGYTDKILTVDVSDASVTISDIPAEVKEKFVGGKGYALPVSYTHLRAHET